MIIILKRCLRAYQSAAPSTRDFNLRLIELTAVALRQVTAHLFQLRLQLHNPNTTQWKDVDGVTLWKREPDERLRTIPWPAIYVHILEFRRDSAVFTAARDGPSQPAHGEQQQMTVDFLLARDEVSSTRRPLPILPGSENRMRIDSRDAISVIE